MPYQVELPDRESKTFWYLAVDANLAQGSQGNQDLGESIEAVALTNAYAPAGIGGEAVFLNLRIAVFRDNAEDMELEVTPIVDGEEQDVIVLDLPAVASGARSIHELGLAVYYPSSADPQIATGMRGTWFQAELRTVGPPESIGRVDGRLVVEGMDLEFSIEREGRAADNAS